MSDPDNQSKVTEGLTNLLPPPIKPWVKALPTLREILRRVSLRLQIIVAIASLGFAVYSGINWKEKATAINARIEDTLKGELDNTVWQHKGFAAYLLSSKYWITMIRRDHSQIRVLVQGERIIFPTIKREQYPHRFGIFREWQEVTEGGEGEAKRPGKEIRGKSKSGKTQGAKEANVR